MSSVQRALDSVLVQKIESDQQSTGSTRTHNSFKDYFLTSTEVIQLCLQFWQYKCKRGPKFLTQSKNVRSWLITPEAALMKVELYSTSWPRKGQIVIVAVENIGHYNSFSVQGRNECQDLRWPWYTSEQWTVTSSS